MTAADSGSQIRVSVFYTDADGTPERLLSSPTSAVLNANTAPTRNLRRVERLFANYCTACHGRQGRGDGPIAEQWPRLPKDLTHPDRQARLTDGEIYWKITTGLKEGGQIIMPTFADEIAKDEDRWKLVHYVRALGTRQ